MEPPRIRLRPLTPEDLPRLHRWYQTPELWDHLVGAFQPRSEAEALAYMTGWLTASPDELRLGMEAEGPQGARLVGLAALSPIDRAAGFAELHIFLGEAADRGQGLGRAATAALMARAFAEGVGRVELKVLESNLPARRLYQRLGFREVGRAAPVQKHGRAVEVLRMAADQPASATT